MSDAYNQAAYQRDMEFNKITPDPVLPALGGVGNWPDAGLGAASVISSPVNAIPGTARLGEDKVLPAPGNTYRRSLLLLRGR